MSTSAQRLNRAALARAVKEEQRRLRAAALEQLRMQIAGIHRRRRELVERVRAQCKRARARVKDRIVERRAAVKAALEREIAEMRQAERNRCALRKARVRVESESARVRLRREERQRRRDEAATRRIERHRTRELAKQKKAERQQESDDAVRSNIDDELVPIFNVVKARVRARPGMSRTETFLHWIEENPSEVWALREDLAEKRLRALIQEEKEAARALRKVGGRVSAKARRAALAPAPF
jgi:hypothetical protein